MPIPPHEIEQRLRGLNTPGDLQRFFRDMDYEAAVDALPLTVTTSKAVPKEASRILNRVGSDKNGYFNILFTRLERLSRTAERALIEALLPAYPYALFVFSDADCHAWHFVNVKLIRGSETDSKARRLYRPALPLVRTNAYARLPSALPC